MSVTFTAHNIRLDDGSYTRPEAPSPMEAHPWFKSAKRMLDTVFPGDKEGIRIADLGCLEGGYATEFARMGFDSVGIEVRDSNIAACHHVSANTNLPNLKFIQDDVWNIAEHGAFDAIFCCGLLYHLDNPRKFLELLAKVTRKAVLIQTHFATAGDGIEIILPKLARRVFQKSLNTISPKGKRKYNLSKVSTNEGLLGRWFTEFGSEEEKQERESSRWASWDNNRSFWLLREHLLHAIEEVGFDLVLEQFDGLEPDIATSMTRGHYHQLDRSMFVGVKVGP